MRPTTSALRSRFRFGKTEMAGLIVLVIVIGLMLLLRFRYPERACVRWEARIVHGEDGSRAMSICAEYR